MINLAHWVVIAAYFIFFAPVHYEQYRNWKIKRAFKKELEDVEI